MKYQVDELSRQNEVICANIAYIHKQGVGYGLENAKRQQAYEGCKDRYGRACEPHGEACGGGCNTL